jgi:hypothetical protein
MYTSYKERQQKNVNWIQKQIAKNTQAMCLYTALKQKRVPNGTKRKT